ncbi:MAG: MBL fold metallo-hydrolase [Myxococcota bacterium]
MKIEIIPSQISDNFFYLLYADDGSDGLLIDPIDSTHALERAKALGVTVTTVVNTHWHPDHVGGNSTVLDATQAELLVPADERDRIQGHGKPLDEGDTLRIGDTELTVLATPGHTEGHISLLTDGHLFCGDTVFVGGAGNCRFGGDPVILHRSFQKLAQLPDDTLLYTGHDYARRNLAFCLDLEPNNHDAKAFLDSIRDQPESTLTLSTIGREKRYSPFFRTAEEGLQAQLKANRTEAWSRQDEALEGSARAFVTIRELRNVW